MTSREQTEAALVAFDKAIARSDIKQGSLVLRDVVTSMLDNIDAMSAETSRTLAELRALIDEMVRLPTGPTATAILPTQTSVLDITEKLPKAKPSAAQKRKNAD